LTKLLDEELARPDCSDEPVTALLRKAVFNAEEWRSHLGKATTTFSGAGAAGEGPQSVLLAQRPGYTLMLYFWGHHAQQLFTAKCRGFGRSWTLVLEGELEERSYSVQNEAPPPHRVNGVNGVSGINGAAGPGGEQQRRRLLRVGTLKSESVSFLNGEEEVQLCCDSDVPCVSLHLFSPALAAQGPLTSLSNLPA